MNKININSSLNQKRILITGVSGLIGRILFNYLTNKYSEKYQIYGLDQHMNISSRYQQINEENLQIETILPISLDKFFQCDILDKNKLYQIIQKQNINIIIHLAALLENHPNLNQISLVNIEGTKNIFEAPGVDRIIYASSVRTVFGYLTRQPYLSIFNDTFDDKTMLNNLRKLTVKDDPPLPSSKSPGDYTYEQSKIICEHMAKDIIKNNSKSIITVRVGWVRIYDQPGKTWLRTVWISHKDLCSFFDKAIHAPHYISGIYFAISNNHRLWVDLDDAKRDLNYIPEDGAEKFK